MTVLISFFDVKDVVHFEFILHSQTVHAYYTEILKPLREAVLEKGLNFGPVNGSSQ